MMTTVHPTATVEDGAIVDPTASVWHYCHLREGCELKEDVSLGKSVYVDRNVLVDKGTRIQNGVSLYEGLRIGRWCFIGPHSVFTNDLLPRVGVDDWKVIPTVLEDAASIGAGSVILCGVKISAFSMVGAGSTVTQSVPPFHLIMGSPARIIKMICACGKSSFPVGTLPSELLQPCCAKNLKKETLQAAKDYLEHWRETLRDQPTWAIDDFQGRDP